MEHAQEQKQAPKGLNGRPLQLLVVECQGVLNWFEIFEGAEFNGLPIKVDQAEWDDISLVSYGDGAGCVVTMRAAKKPIPHSPQTADRTIQVDFVLLRSVTRGIHNQDSRNLLYGLLHANIPSVNTLHSAVLCLERPIVFGQLKKIQKKLGKQNFPLIDQSYYPDSHAMVVTPDLPAVVKMGHAHAGYGKAKVKSAEEVQDVRSIAALHGDYITAENFIDWDWDGRIQKIGNHYRVFRRVSMNWKGNVGNSSIIEDMEMNDRYQQWIDECGKVFGGLDICGLDFLHGKDGKEYILELNDTAIGLVHKHAHEDMLYMRDVVMIRMNEHYKEAIDHSALNIAKMSATTSATTTTTTTTTENASGSNNSNNSNNNADDDLVSKLREELKFVKAQLEREQQEKKKLEEKLAESSKKKKFGLFSS